MADLVARVLLPIFTPQGGRHIQAGAVSHTCGCQKIWPTTKKTRRRFAAACLRGVARGLGGGWWSVGLGRGLGRAGADHAGATGGHEAEAPGRVQAGGRMCHWRPSFESCDLVSLGPCWQTCPCHLETPISVSLGILNTPVISDMKCSDMKCRSNIARGPSPPGSEFSDPSGPRTSFATARHKRLQAEKRRTEGVGGGSSGFARGKGWKRLQQKQGS